MESCGSIIRRRAAAIQQAHVPRSTTPNLSTRQTRSTGVPPPSRRRSSRRRGEEPAGSPAVDGGNLFASLFASRRAGESWKEGEPEDEAKPSRRTPAPSSSRRLRPLSAAAAHSSSPPPPTLRHRRIPAAAILAGHWIPAASILVQLCTAPDRSSTEAITASEQRRLHRRAPLHRPRTTEAVPRPSPRRQHCGTTDRTEAAPSPSPRRSSAASVLEHLCIDLVQLKQYRGHHHAGSTAAILCLTKMSSPLDSFSSPAVESSLYMAHDILAIPVTTVASESAFSTSGRILSAHRCSLAPNMTEALMCMQAWSRADMLGDCNSTLFADFESVLKDDTEIMELDDQSILTEA